MRFTVIGADGFVGSHLIRHLQEQTSHECVAVGRKAALAPELLRGHVIYCAGLTGDFTQRPLDTMAAHVGLLEKVLREGKFDSLLYLSSTRVYQKSERTDETADLRVNPHDASDLYNLSKLAGESLCVSQQRRAVRVARLANIFDPGFSSPTFIPDLFQQARKNGRIVIYSSPDSAKDYLSLEDLLPLLLKISLGGKQTIYNVASGRNTTNQQIADVFVRALGCGVEFAAQAPRTIHPPIDISLIAREFSFKPADFLGRLSEILAAKK